jgi:hypothetical protein
MKNRPVLPDLFGEILWLQHKAYCLKDLSFPPNVLPMALRFQGARATIGTSLGLAQSLNLEY